ncbi:DNRLRE domain-containing protein [Sphaerisporangium fuscum]|uniref:DNRLRE domain-containing protein n=1 Tax=Sphaerisporangium fuscum TaxID=2835868 RepID=UPI001BDBC36F|nr:DNRLRE domain-containing protein [Sphaerisporangium fuscum]
MTIDPTTTLTATSDTTLGSRSECGTFDSPEDTLLKVGGELWRCSGTSKFQYFRSYLQFDTSALEGKAIYSAALQLWRTQAGACSARGDGKVWASPLADSWTAGSLTWYNKPSTGEGIVGTICPTTGVNTPAAMSWPITNWVKKWSAGTPNYGIELSGPTEDLVNDWDGYSVLFHSTEMTGAGATPPKLIVQYFLPPEIPTVTAESVDSMDADQAIVRTSSVKVGYKSSSVDGRNLDYYLSVLDSTAPLPAWTTGAGAVGQWSFTEGAESSDSSGNKHSLVMVSGRYAYIDGKDGKGLQLNGATAVPSYASTQEPVLHTDKSFSVAGWVRLDVTPTWAAGFFSQQNSTQDGFVVGYNPNTRKWDMTLRSSGTASKTIASSATGSTGTWTHLAAIYDASAHKMRLYVNGALSAEDSYTSTSDTWSSNSQFFINPSGGSLTASKASYDEVRAYQRALSETEIKWMLNLTPPTNANLPSGQSATKTYDVSNVDSFKVSVKACLNGVTPITCSESPYYRITTDAPYLPTDTETGMADPTQPILSGMVNRPSGGPVVAKYYLYDGTGAPIGSIPLGKRDVKGGERASFQLPADTVQPGTIYKWQMQACVEEICTAKTNAVSFATPGTPPADPIGDVRHLTLSRDSFVIKAAKTGPTACNGSPCVVTDTDIMQVSGTGTDQTAMVIGFRLGELPDGAQVSEALLNLGTPTCPAGSCAADTIINVKPLRGEVTSETRGSDLAAEVDDEGFQMPITSPIADIAGYEYAWLLVTSNREGPVIFGDPSALNRPSLSLAYAQPGPPSKVLNLSTAPGDGGATVSWGVPESSGGNVLIDSYDIEVLDAGGHVLRALETASTSTSIAELTNGSIYTIRVRARTRIAPGEWEAASVSPRALTIPIDRPADSSQDCNKESYANTIRAYFEAQNVVLEHRAPNVWDLPAAEPSGPIAAQLALINRPIVTAAQKMESSHVNQKNAAVQVHDVVAQETVGGQVLVNATVDRTRQIEWVDPAGATDSKKDSRSTNIIFRFRQCGDLDGVIDGDQLYEDSDDFFDDAESGYGGTYPGSSSGHKAVGGCDKTKYPVKGVRLDACFLFYYKPLDTADPKNWLPTTSFTIDGAEAWGSLVYGTKFRKSKKTPTLSKNRMWRSRPPFVSTV